MTYYDEICVFKDKIVCRIIFILNNDLQRFFGEKGKGGGNC